MPITVPKSVRCSPLFGSVVLLKFDISFRILTIVLFRATLKYIFLLHVACLLVKSRVFWCLCLAFEESLLITMFSKVARQEEDFPPKKKRKSFGYSEEWKIIKTVWDVFRFHVSYTRELFPAELWAKVTTLPPRE